MNLTLDSFSPYLLPIHSQLLRVIVTELKLASIVGGAIRDLYFNYPIDDIDFVLNDPSDGAVENLVLILTKTGIFKKVEISLPLTSYRTAKILVESDTEGAIFDVALPRKEFYSNPGAKPLVKAGSFEDDISRRDFSINTLSVRGRTDNNLEVIDLKDGLLDLENKVLRILHANSFIDDPIRVIRGLRFFHRYNLTWDDETHERSLDENVLTALENVSQARRSQEIYKVLFEENVFQVLNDISERNLVHLMLPRITLPELSSDSYTLFLRKKNLDNCIHSLLAYLFHESSEKNSFDILKLMPITKAERKKILSDAGCT